MQIACPTCDKRLQIADEKLPTDRKVRITCPACQENFTYNPEGTAMLSVVPRTDAPVQPETTPGEAAANPMPAPPARSAAMSVPTLNLDVMEAGPPPRVLVCVDDAAQRRDYDEIFTTLGFSTIHSTRSSSFLNSSIMLIDF